ncbi:MAG TPA: hypothetical protein DD413_03735, partial [Ruminococcus sp.]|nr:hypothetical protein [Ruminococcus sp.]
VDSNHRSVKQQIYSPVNFYKQLLKVGEFAKSNNIQHNIVKNRKRSKFEDLLKNNSKRFC